jgi:hypothetical protein
MGTPQCKVSTSTAHKGLRPSSRHPASSIPTRSRRWFENWKSPFDPAVIEWRVTNTAQNKTRGQVIPYADQRAYTDRLNALFTPAGWTRKYTVYTSANFERSKAKKVVAKILVTCELTMLVWDHIRPLARSGPMTTMPGPARKPSHLSAPARALASEDICITLLELGLISTSIGGPRTFPHCPVGLLQRDGGRDCGPPPNLKAPRLRNSRERRPGPRMIVSRTADR